VREVFSECISVPDGTDLQQGDVFAFHKEDEGGDPWRQIGIVVTADCDLANDKHRGILSYVPVLSLRGYLAQITMPKIAVDQRSRSLRRLSEVVKQVETIRGHTVGLSDRAMEEFATMEDGPAELAAYFDPIPADQFNQIEVAISEIKVCDRVSALSSYEDIFSALVQIFRPSKRKTAEEILTAELRNRLNNLPGDAFFISSLGDARRDGYVAYLRLVRELRATQVCTAYIRRHGRGISAERISRLRAPYLYRLTQLLAEVFASIGLPEEYESAREEVFESSLAATPSGVLADAN